LAGRPQGAPVQKNISDFNKGDRGGHKGDRTGRPCLQVDKKYIRFLRLFLRDFRLCDERRFGF
jgi:hypothetical protein